MLTQLAKKLDCLDYLIYQLRNGKWDMPWAISPAPRQPFRQPGKGKT